MFLLLKEMTGIIKQLVDVSSFSLLLSQTVTVLNRSFSESKNFYANERWFLWNAANSRSYKASAVTICYHLSRFSNTSELVFFQPETLLIVPAAGR